MDWNLCWSLIAFNLDQEQLAPFVNELTTLLASEPQKLKVGIQQDLELLRANKQIRNVRGCNRACSPALTFKDEKPI